jgi:hypothetical protein
LCTLRRCKTVIRPVPLVMVLLNKATASLRKVSLNRATAKLRSKATASRRSKLTALLRDMGLSKVVVAMSALKANAW